MENKIYIRFLTGLLFTVIIANILMYRASTSKTPNYLYAGSLSLDQHLISTGEHSDKKKVVFLGSSAVSGSNTPKNSTIADYYSKFATNAYAYNIATYQSNLVENLTYFLLSLKYKPKVAILGINPSTFSQSYGSTVVLENENIIKKFLPIEIKKSIKLEKVKKFNPFIWFERNMKKKMPLDSHITWRTFLNNLSKKLFGNVYSAKMFGGKKQKIAHALNLKNPQFKLLKKFKMIALQNNVQPIIYLEPIYKPFDIYGEKEFKQYHSQIINFLDQMNIKYFDYTNFVPPTREYYLDFIHIRPKAYRNLAHQIHLDTKDFLE